MNYRLLVAALCAAVGVACNTPKPPPAPAPPPPPRPPPPAATVKVPTVPLFGGLGKHTRKVTTTSPQAQRYFDQGLAFVYGFNHDEAIRAFAQAAEIDPQCAMAHWGVALANGPHINNPAVDEAHAKAAWEALSRAREFVRQAAPAERALIDALGARYAMPQPADRKALDQAYADAMKQVQKAYPDDGDAAALYAEALMDLRPWDLWKPDGNAQPGTNEIVTTLEQVLVKNPYHPLANHLYIHAIEASPLPEKADPAANRLRDLQPGLGHMVHMPSHIDVRRGRWEAAALANEKAIGADTKYKEAVPGQSFYRLYMAHNRHMLAFAAIMQGQSEKALASINAMIAEMPAEWIKESAGIADGFMAMPMEVMMRFGKWDEILAAPEPAEYLPIARAMRLYARGVAYAAQGKKAEARAEQTAFLEAKAKVSEGAFFGNNKASDILGVAEHLLAGEILYREGKVDKGIGEMKIAVKREDELRYDEPPDWIQPVRHALGAALVRSNRPVEAAAVYREDLKRLPENGWSLFGLAKALKMQKSDEAADVQERFAKVWANADVKLMSSCFCQPGI
jgi:tetratricopeptide (TPR) repeat protein